MAGNGLSNALMAGHVRNNTGRKPKPCSKVQGTGNQKAEDF